MAESHYFISYSRKNRPVVEKIAEHMRLHGSESWVDESYLKPAQRFSEKIEEAVRLSVAVVFVISKESLKSQYCAKELLCALENNVRIIPVEIEPIEDSWKKTEGAKRALDEYHALQLNSGEQVSDSTSLESLLERLVETLGGAWEDEEPAARIRSLTERWNKADPEKKNGYLLADAELQNVDEWLRKQRRGEVRLGQNEREFLFQSRQSSEARQRQLSNVLNKEQRAERRSELRDLMLRAREVRRESPQRAVLMAAQIYRLAVADRMPEVNAEGVLRELISEISGRRLDSGTAGTVGFVTAPDNLRCAILTRDDRFKFINFLEDNPNLRRLTSVGDLGAIHPARGTRVMAFSPDSRILAAGGWLDGSVILWEFSEDDHPSAPVRLPGRGAAKSFVGFSPDGAFLVAWASTLSGGDVKTKHEVTLWDLRTPDRERTELKVAAPPGSVLFAPGSAAVCISLERDPKNRLSLWRLEPGHSPTPIPLPNDVSQAGGFLKDGSLVVITAEPHSTVQVIDSAGRSTMSLPSREVDFSSVDFVHTGTNSMMIGVRGAKGEELELWTVPTAGKPRLLWSDTKTPLTSFWMSPDETFLILIFEDHAPVIINMDPDSEWCATSLEAHEPRSQRVVLMRDTGMEGARIRNWVSTWRYHSQGLKRAFYTGGYDGQVLCWDLGADQVPRPSFVHAHSGPVTALAISGDPPRVASAGPGHSYGGIGAAEILVHENGPSQVLVGHDDTIDELVFVEGTDRLLSFASLESLRIWRLGVSNMDVLPARLDVGMGITSMVSDSRGETIVVGRTDGVVEQYVIRDQDLRSRRIAKLAGEIVAVRHCEGSLNAAVAMMPSQQIVCWKLDDDGSPRVVSFSLEDSPCSLLVSNTGKWVAVGTRSGEVGVVRMEKGRAVPPSLVSVGRQSATAFTIDEPTGRIAIGTGFYFSEEHGWMSRGGMVYVAELPSIAGPLRQVGSFLGTPGGSVVDLRFAKGGQELIVAGSDGAVRVWNLNDLGQTIATYVHPAVSDERPELSAFDIDRTVSWAVAGFRDGSVMQWDLLSLPSDQVSLPRRLHEAEVTCLRIDEMARFAVSGAGDGSVVRLSNSDPVLSTVLHRHESTVVDVAISSTGTITSADNKGTILFSPNGVEEVFECAERIVGRNFTREEWNRFLPDASYQKTFAGLPLEPEREARGTKPFDEESFIDLLDENQYHLPTTLRSPERQWRLLLFGGVTTAFPSDWRIESSGDRQCILTGPAEGQTILLAVCTHLLRGWTLEEAIRLAHSILHRSVSPLDPDNTSEEEGSVCGIVTANGKAAALYMNDAGDQAILTLTLLGTDKEAIKDAAAISDRVIEALCSPGIPLVDIRRRQSGCGRFWINIPSSWSEASLSDETIELKEYRPEVEQGYCVGVAHCGDDRDALEALSACIKTRQLSDFEVLDHELPSTLYTAKASDREIQGTCFHLAQSETRWLVFVEVPKEHFRIYPEVLSRFITDTGSGFLLNRVQD